ncbi:antigenic cell wall galactomannoprotein [Talaromyces proteolyticus]|uniref:Antigenic cell wall galactomannoprotein n=1 Tax=Talaromyces proteolyticus TaxID=1131652 RepID=A0AAD4KF44_9EURO|nr:antigenic cell wall galactomannoprotein [Talaromyces proteolyticus]KAH8690522.1 antigenic cell wall galactomannoprotein [Talaromyces proteolyticus]
MYSVKNVFLFSLALSLPTHGFCKRDEASSVISGIQKISDAVITLNKTVSSYPGGIEGTITALDILGDSFSLEHAITSTTSDAKQSANFTDTESQSIAQAFVNLVPTIQSSLTTIEGKKSEFQHGLLGLASLDWVVEDLLKTLKSDSDALSTAVIAKLTSTWAGVAPLVVSQIDAAFETAITTYST